MHDAYFIEKYQVPLNIEVLEELQKMLRDASLLLSVGEEFERYQALTYRRQKVHHHSDSCALLDRNALNDVLSIVRPAAEGRIEPCMERGRIGAAMMAFLQCANILIEPNIALYENPNLAEPELRLFRQADNVAPAIYAQIALGQLDSLPLDCVPAPPPRILTAEFFRPISNTQKFRIALLKIAELDLSPLSNAEKLRRFLQWSFDDFCILAVPTLTAITHFSPHRKSSILQGLRSPDRARAWQGVQNALWDMITIQQWAKKVEQQSKENRIWLLCSRDEALKRIAGVLHRDEASNDQSLRTIFKDWWGTSQGDELTKLAITLQQDSGNSKRRANQVAEEGFLRELEDDLKNRVLAWSAEHRSA